ncbi:PRC-barrel domain-containing protein [Pseudoroseomonas cervicalis]|uniref:PRC-barrel domain-containing protein n=1 Tax=Teichococcus cervicalis TaxID=204525 RepID=UPI0022F1AAF6|nr:PRC-barrel domain-containing protein [Pseudoroseomonas cervicalis]WBV43329.1 PRC-barrel domain-containing protein [Pseudoroseomonas cervicalis]
MPSKGTPPMRKTMLFSSAAALCLAPWLASAQPAANQNQAQPRPGQAAQAPAAQGQANQGQRNQGQRNQGQAQARPGGDNRQQAEQCLRDLTAFSEHMEQEGYWLTGYRQGFGWSGLGAGAGADGARPPSTGTPAGAPASRQGDAAAPRPAEAAAQEGETAGPWANLGWRTAPAQELGTLYRAAAVLAHRGDEQTCQAVLGKAREAYDSYAGQLREAGVEPGQMVSYRQQQLAAAQPVAEMQRNFRADTITGTDVRNPQDEYLGSVEDVVLDPGSGRIGYVILSRGGFLGFGTDYVALPWASLRATPQMDAFVLRASEAVLEEAPKVDPDSFANAEASAERRQEIDRFWQQQTQGG